MFAADFVDASRPSNGQIKVSLADTSIRSFGCDTRLERTPLHPLGDVGGRGGMSAMIRNIPKHRITFLIGKLFILVQYADLRKVSQSAIFNLCP